SVEREILGREQRVTFRPDQIEVVDSRGENERVHAESPDRERAARAFGYESLEPRAEVARQQQRTEDAPGRDQRGHDQECRAQSMASREGARRWPPGAPACLRLGGLLP